MSKIKVCALFRPLNSKERDGYGDKICIQRVDSESFVIKDEKEEFEFGFDRVFYPGSPQADVYEFLALPILQGALNGLNGAIITYGQTGAGKTYSLEGPSIMAEDVEKKGLLPRVVDGLFEAIKLSDQAKDYTIKLSMVEIYMERVRDLFDLSKDNIKIKENKQLGIFLSGATEINVTTSAEALQILCSGIANRAVGETQMNMSSSRSHCIYMFTIQQEVKSDRRSGKLILVDLAGSEKVEKTAAEGKVLDEAKTINKSLSALGNVINALTSDSPGKANHIPYRDSKLTRLLQGVIGGNSQTALLCCCSPSPSNISESLSSLRFGARAKHIKASVHVTSSEDADTKKQGARSLNKDEQCERVLAKLRGHLTVEVVDLLEELFTLEGILFYPNSAGELESTYEDITSKTISSLQNALVEQSAKIEELRKQNMILEAHLSSTRNCRNINIEAQSGSSFLSWIPYITLFKYWQPWLFQATSKMASLR
ncbi:OLC1v1000533C1 [Oldenlandia corymbosa var. corymbosa]|uniref:Kinesin-like protein n=1 Tax=Oldenlandia corymbosa var. corymbosa TaxID=529605 RepID=A0AAV1D3H9_OLDCO|nr:OLC1v1000533C1 [Oldenlandia corymbosa var. corymbosa]